MNFEDKRRLENHKKVHGRKPKVYEYGDPEFNKDAYKKRRYIHESIMWFCA
jgi:hypothetical protein